MITTLNSRWTLEIISGSSGTLTNYDDGYINAEYDIRYYKERNHITIGNYYNVPPTVLDRAKREFKKYNKL